MENYEVPMFDPTMLGCSPAETSGLVEANRSLSFATHEGEAELRLNDTVFDGKE